MLNEMMNNNTVLIDDIEVLRVSGREGAAERLEKLRLAELDAMRAVANYLALPDSANKNPSVKIIRRGIRLFLALLVLTVLAMLLDPTLGLIVLFLTCVQLFATAYAYETVAGETIIDRRRSLLGMLMFLALALLAFIGLFF